MKPANFISDCTNLFVGWQPSNYSFNNQEHDDEMYGDGNAISFDARMLDVRLARWLSVDPLFAKYPSISPYGFVANSPLIMVDRDGKDIIIWYKEGNEYKPTRYTAGMKVSSAPGAARATVAALNEIHKISTVSVQPTIGYDANAPTPMQVIEELSTSKEYRVNVVAVDLDVWKTDPAFEKKATAQTNQNEKGATILYSTEVGAYEVDANNTPTWLRRSVVGILAHEIKHAFDSKRGKIKDLKNQPDSEFGTKSEKSATVFENTVVLNRPNTVDRSGERDSYKPLTKVLEATVNSQVGTTVLIPNSSGTSKIPVLDNSYSKTPARPQVVPHN